MLYFVPNPSHGICYHITPRIIEDWGPTTPSVYKMSSFSCGPKSFAVPMRLAWEKYISIILRRKNIETTSRSMRQGLVDRIERSMSSGPPKELVRKLIVERYLFWLELVFAISWYKTLSVVGLREKMSLKAAGIQTEPFISVPTLSILSRIICIASFLLDKLPHKRFWLLELSVCPMMMFFIFSKRRVWSGIVLQYSTASNDKSSVVIWLSTWCAWLGSLMPILFPSQLIYPIVV